MLFNRLNKNKFVIYKLLVIAYITNRGVEDLQEVFIHCTFSVAPVVVFGDTKHVTCSMLFSFQTFASEAL